MWYIVGKPIMYIFYCKKHEKVLIYKQLLMSVLVLIFNVWTSIFVLNHMWYVIRILIQLRKREKTTQKNLSKVYQNACLSKDN